MAEVNETNRRTRVNISISTKGVATFDCTCEYDTPEQVEAELSKTIDMVRKLIKDKGLTSAEDAA